VCKNALSSAYVAGASGRSPAEIVVSNPTGGMDFCRECCMLSGRGLCDALITRPEESYGQWCVTVCDLETSWMRRLWPALGRSATKKKFGCVCEVTVLAFQPLMKIWRRTGEFMQLRGIQNKNKALVVQNYTPVSKSINIQGYSKWLSGF